MPAYVVGGTVRDLLLGGDPADKDIDFVIVGDAVQFAKSAEQEYSGMLRIFPAFLTAKIISPALFSTISEVDFATSRKEIYTSPGKLPEVTPAPIADDLKRRDFTINAMAIPVAALLRWGAENFGDPAKLAAETMDLFAGRSDLEKRIIRILHEGSFIDDPTRIFRGCRYAVRISGKFDPTSVQRIAQAIRGGAFGTISPQRIMNEIKKIFFERRTAEVLEVLDSLKIEIIEKNILSWDNLFDTDVLYWERKFDELVRSLVHDSR